MQYKDFYWLNDDSRLFLSRGYINPNQTAEQRLTEIANNAEKILNKKGFAEKFLSYLAKGYYSLSTPVWTNFGNNKGLPVSCFGSYIPDSMEGILTKNAEVGMMSKYAGGTSGFFGDVRPRGSHIKSIDAKSFGSVHFMELFDKVTNIVSQGSVRRGSFAAYLPIEHEDIMEFLQIRSDGHPIQNMSFGITVTDKWMEEMISGDFDKRKIWAKVLQKRAETGYPYISFIDNINNANPKFYKDKNLKVKASNLCVAGDQRVVSDRGLLTAEELYKQGGNLILFDNDKEVNSSPMKLIEKNADVFEIELENGLTHKITSYHKVLTRTSGTFEKTRTKNTICSDLKIGDYVAFQTRKGIFGPKNMSDEAFLLGLYQADGTQTERSINICLWENDFDLLEEAQHKFNSLYKKYNGDQYIDFSRSKIKKHSPVFKECNVTQSKVRKKSLNSPFLKRCLDFKKGIVPNWIWESDEKTQWEYIRGLFYADGTVNVTNGKGSPFYLSITNINKSFLRDLQILLLNLGIKTSLSIMRDERKVLLPDDKGSHKYYNCKTAYRLVCGNKNDGLEFEKNTKFLSRKGIVLDESEYRDNSKKFCKIKSITHVGKEDVYCVKVESDQHHWVCNGFITHNCNEIALHSDEQNSFVCVLSSLNLLHWDSIVKTDAIETMIYFLDSVNQEFVDKTENNLYLKPAHNFAKNHRALGLGVLGWHSLLQSKNIAFESMEAKFLNNSIFSKIRERTDEATKELASEYGECPVCEGYERRNTHTIAIAPTTSSAFILGQVSPSIEPLNSNYFVKKLAKGNFVCKNEFLEKLLINKNKNTEKVWKQILVNGGSVQKLDFLSDEEKAVFKTFGEISQKEVIIQAANRQRFIDQGQSLNMMIPPNTPPKDINSLIIFAWENKVKGLYYQRSSNPAQELGRKITECASCES